MAIPEDRQKAERHDWVEQKITSQMGGIYIPFAFNEDGEMCQHPQAT